MTKMPADIELSPTSSLMADEPNAREGRIGLLVLDNEADEVVAFTAAQIEGKSGLLKSGASIIGRALRIKPRIGDNAPSRLAETMIVKIVVNSEVKLSRQQPSLAEGDGVSCDIELQPHELVGETVLVHTATSGTRQAYLYSARGSFRMTCPFTEKPTLFTDAIQLETLDELPLTKKGDAGALVTTISGNPLGTIICGFEKVSFAAPFSNIIDSVVHSLLSAEFIEERNLAIDAFHKGDTLTDAAAPMNSKLEPVKFDLNSYVKAVSEDNYGVMEDMGGTVSEVYLR